MTAWKRKRVLVAGGTGTIGIPLVRNLVQSGAVVTVTSIDSPEYAKGIFGNTVTFFRSDLTQYENCLFVTRNQDYVFNLVGIKGSVGIGETKVASYLVPMLWFQTNLMEAAFRNNIERYLFVSSICAYPESRIPKREDTVWDGMPKQNDRFPGLAKRIGEVQAEAYLREYGWDAVRIVRPANVYGPYDDFNPATAQVIPALIGRILRGENPLKIWGDGSAIRDFIYSDDVAYWIIRAMESAPPCVPINLGSGSGTSVRELVELIAPSAPSRPSIEWDPTRPTGDPVRILSVVRAKEILGYEVKTGLAAGISKTMQWYRENRDFNIERQEKYRGS